MATWRDRDERKRTRDDHDIVDGPPFSKRGRRSDPTGYRGGARDRGGRGGDGPRREMSTEDRLVSFIERVGDTTQSSLESNLESLAELICQELSEYKDKILQIITKCARELSEKTSIYTTLIGILNARKFDIGNELVDLLFEDLKSALALNKFSTVKTLVRFLSDLMNAKVIPSSSIISLFDTFVTVTYEPGISQLRSDWYTYLILSALPWVGMELQNKRQPELDRILSAIEGYMNKRVTNYLPALQVWQTDRPYPQRDQLELLWLQILKMKEDGWKEVVLIRPYIAFDSEISSSYTHPLPNIVVPGHTLDSTYPLPVSVFRCIGEADLPAHIGPSFPSLESIDRYLIQDLIHSIIFSHSNNRKNCAHQLNSLMERLHHLPVEYMVAEVLFGLIFQLPTPPHCLIYYGSLTIELCVAVVIDLTTPMQLSQIIDILFSQLDHMNYVVVDRFAWWFSYHLANYQYYWEWNKWVWVVQCSSDNASYWFVKQVFERCSRLASYEVFCDFIPELFLPLMPHPPDSMYPYQDDSESVVPGTELAKKLIEAIRSKLSIEELLMTLETAAEYFPDFDNEKLIDIKVSVLTHCVLHVGDKTISHCFIALHKFRSLFLDILETENAKFTCLTSVAQYFENNSQLYELVVDRLVHQELLDNLIVIKWLFTVSNVNFNKRLSWDIIRGCCTRVSKGLQQSERELDNIKEKLKQSSGLVEVIGGNEEKQELEWKLQEMEEKVDEKKKEQREVHLAICKHLVDILSTHLNSCDLEAVDYETTWFVCIIDNLRQMLIQNHVVYRYYTHLLENDSFSSDTDPRILEIYQQFQAIL